MTPEEKFFQEVWWVLQKLKYLKISKKKGEVVDFVIQARPPTIRPTDEPPTEAQTNVLLKLEERKIIKIVDQEIQDVTYGKDCIFALEFLPSFDRFYKKWEEIDENPWLSEESRIVQRKKLLGEGRITFPKEKTTEQWLLFHTKDGVELKFNTESGDFIFGEVENSLAPDTQEFNVLLTLLKNKLHQAQDITLLKAMYPEKKEFTKMDRWGLNEIIRNIKEELGILPKKQSRNKDIFKRLKKWKGYKLNLKIR